MHQILVVALAVQVLSMETTEGQVVLVVVHQVQAAAAVDRELQDHQLVEAQQVLAVQVLHQLLAEYP